MFGSDYIQEDGRNRLSRIWVPTGGIAISPDEGITLRSQEIKYMLIEIDSHAKLVRAGFLRQVCLAAMPLQPPCN